MKKFFSNVVIFLSLIFVSLVAIPWNRLSQWGVNITYLDNNEVLVKGGIGALLFLFSLIFFFVGNHEYNEYGHVKKQTVLATFLPLIMYSFAGILYAAALMYFVRRADPTLNNLIILVGLLAALVNILMFSHVLLSSIGKRKTFPRIILYFMAFELMLAGGGAAYYVYQYKALTGYTSYYTYNHILIGAAFIGFYLLHLVVILVRKSKYTEEVVTEESIQEIKSVEAPKKVKESRKQGLEIKEKDSKKTLIVSKEQTIVSGNSNLDPTDMMYEDVVVDPEFSKTSNQDKQVSSIEYYIEKPKMFKPLDPSFDQLVEYVREMPQVVTKLSDDKITFYIDRKPFLVLMNYGNYYRMAFKYELEKGIRLIIKYPTISKNKGTKDELWFKANNYGDLPKEVVYQIVKTSYDNVNA